MECQHKFTEVRAVSLHIGIFCTTCGAFIKWTTQPITQEKLDAFIMPIGVHKGKHLSEIPVPYLEWAATNISSKSIQRHCMAFLERLSR